jgi:hypothetical protein
VTVLYSTSTSYVASYFEHLFPYLAKGDMSATQNIYSNDWAFQRDNETRAGDLDEYCSTTCEPNTAPRFFQRQFSSLYAWSNVRGSSYNAGQLILRHAMSHGVQFDFTYTFSNSIDLGSDTEWTNELNATGSTLYNSGAPSPRSSIHSIPSSTGQSPTSTRVTSLMPIGSSSCLLDDGPEVGVGGFRRYQLGTFRHQPHDQSGWNQQSGHQWHAGTIQLNTHDSPGPAVLTSIHLLRSVVPHR